MTSLHRLSKAVSPEDGRSPVLPFEAIKASLGQYGVSAADQLLSSSGVGAELHTGGHSMESITHPEIKALFEQDYATYQHIFENGGITMPTPEELASGGIDWVHLAELKKSHPDHDLVVAPLTLSLEEVRRVASYNIGSNRLLISRAAIDRWDSVMEAAANAWHLPSAVATRKSAHSPLNYTTSYEDSPIDEQYTKWAAFLIAGHDQAEHPGISLSNGQSSTPTVPLIGYISYQLRRIMNSQAPVDTDTCTWSQGKIDDIKAGAVCAPVVNWNQNRRKIRIALKEAHLQIHNIGVRTPIA